jgi:hypothetical protein
VRCWLVLVAFVVAGCGEHGDGSAESVGGVAVNPPPPVGSPPPVAPAPVAASASPSSSAANGYPDSTAGLGRLAADLVTAAREKSPRLPILLESLRLRSPDAWFEGVFGRAKGAELADDYRRVYDEIGQLGGVLERLVADHQTIVTIERFDRAETPESVGYQSAALAKMADPRPLYSLRFASADRARVFHLWSFVYQDGSFRYVGKMKKSVDGSTGGADDLLELRLSEVARRRAPR